MESHWELIAARMGLCKDSYGGGPAGQNYSGRDLRWCATEDWDVESLEVRQGHCRLPGKPERPPSIASLAQHVECPWAGGGLEGFREISPHPGGLLV